MRHKHLALNLFVFTLLSALLCMNTYPFVACNGAGGGYGEGSGDGTGETRAALCNTDNGIEYYIMLAAGYYFDARSDVQELLRAVEWQEIQGVNFWEMQRLAASALFHMENARYINGLLIRTAEATPYNETVLGLLRDFDYDGFKLAKGLNGELFAMARGYLQSGNITGIFKNRGDNYDRVITLLRAIKTDIYNYKMPDLSLFWQLNETLDHISTLGSYVARVFAEIR
jgi:hypothetical protein